MARTVLSNRETLDCQALRVFVQGQGDVREESVRCGDDFLCHCQGNTQEATDDQRAGQQDQIGRHDGLLVGGEGIQYAAGDVPRLHVSS